MSEDWYCKWCHSERDGDHNFGCFMDDRQNTDMPLLTRKADERIKELEAENKQLRKEVVEQHATIMTLRQKLRGEK